MLATNSEGVLEAPEFPRHYYEGYTEQFDRFIDRVSR